MLHKIFLLITFSFLSIVLFAQEREIKGVVTDEEGEPLMGVSVYVKGNPKIGTASNFDGEFFLKVPQDATSLVASYVGMTTIDVPIKGPVVNITMKEESSLLDEVVVIGYQAVKRRDLTGSVASVQGDALQNIPVTNVTEALAGKLAGVQITTTEGSPDATVKIRVRGGGSITQDNTPLYIVDGFPVASISDIPASEITSIDVLKDASSTAIYGSRGANGVIIITTKGGEEGKFTVTYNIYAGIKKIAKKMDVLPVEDYLLWQYERALLRNQLTNYEEYFGSFEDMSLYEGMKGNNWQDLTFGRTGHMVNQSLGLNGGTDMFSYAFNYSRMDDKAIMMDSDYKRNNLSLKLKHKPLSNLTINYSIRYANTDVHGGGMNDKGNEKSSSDARLKHSVIFSPIPFEGSDDGDLELTASDLVNPIKAIKDTEKKQKRLQYNLAGSVSWKAMKHLTLRTDLTADFYERIENRFFGTSTYFVRANAPEGLSGLPALEYYNQRDTRFGNSNTAIYDFAGLFGKKSPHSANILLGQEQYITKSTKLTNVSFGFPSDWDASTTFNHSSQGTPFLIDNYRMPDDKLLSFFGRANYDYDSKYIFAATFRADGSSKFGKGNKWGYFPSVALAWRVSSENFMTPTQLWLNDLKLRISYGSAGNNNIPPGQTIRQYGSSSTSWIDWSNNYWSTSKILFNPDLKWETTYTKNIGMDFTVWQSRVTASIEFYHNNTKNLLNLFPIAGSGYDYQYRNLGETINKGVDISTTFYAVTSKDFDLNFNFNVSINKGKIKSLGMNDYFESSGWASSDITNDFMVAKGRPVGTIYGYKSDGRYEVSDFEGYDEVAKKWILKEGVYDASSIVSNNFVRPGDLKLKDGNKHIIGNTNPKNTGGFTINARYKQFDLMSAFSWSYGNDIYNANKIQFTSTGKFLYRNMITMMGEGKRWTNLLPDGTISNDPSQLAAMNQNTKLWSPLTSSMILTDWAIEDGSFLRLNTLTLGYTLSPSLIKNSFISNVRFYTTIYNVFCLTNYSGFDPEVSTRTRTNLTPGVDYSAYPRSRQFLIGANITF